MLACWLLFVPRPGISAEVSRIIHIISKSMTFYEGKYFVKLTPLPNNSANVVPSVGLALAFTKVPA